MTPASLQGQTIGKYRVLEPLGRGGMARVYRAYHPQLDRYVALKVLRSDLVDDEEFLARFRREARAVATLRHSNIVQVFDSDVEGDAYYIVLELLEGDSLKTRLNDYRVRGERMPLGEMVRVLLDVLDGLGYAHGEGMIHRDIKPANVLLTGRGEAVITDFGIAQIVGGTRHTVSGALMGTLNYMAPEQGLEGQSDARSDIYSLGIVLYEMLTQRVPFDADTPLAVLMKHLNDPLPLPRHVDPSIPEPFERVVLKALAKQPEERYQSAGEMAEVLQQAAEEAEVEIPERISLPLSFTTPEAPLESVAVLSGEARERITDVHFADDDTDASLGEKLAARGVAGGQALAEAGRDLLGAMGSVAQVAMNRTAGLLRKAVKSVEIEGDKPPEPPAGEEAGEVPEAQPAAEDIGEAPGQQLAAEEAAVEMPERARRRDAREGKRERRGVGRAILGALGILALGNLLLVTVALPTDSWFVYERGWPIQIFLAGWGLCLIMYVASSIWMLIPVGPVVVTGVILTYCAFTGRWQDWSFLWLVETWVTGGSIMASIVLAGNKSLARGVSRLLAVIFSLISIALILFIGFILGLDSLIVSLGGTFLP